MRKPVWAVVVLSVWASVAIAGGPSAVRKQVEASMLVTGTIDIDPDGSVSGYLVDRQEALPPDVVRLLARAVPSWKFQPVLEAGEPIRARARTSVRLVAQRLGEDGYTIRVANAHFGSHVEGESPTSKRLTPPIYPRPLAERGVGGTVYLVLKIGKDGLVEDAIAEQVNLRVIASEAAMDRLRDQLARSTLYAARKWTFKAPVAGPEADANQWSVRVPVDFVMGGARPSAYGKWTAYVPGPRQSIPWAEKEDDFETPPDAMLAGGVYSSRSNGPRLLTSLDPN